MILDIRARLLQEALNKRSYSRSSINILVPLEMVNLRLSKSFAYRKKRLHRIMPFLYEQISLRETERSTYTSSQPFSPTNKDPLYSRQWMGIRCYLQTWIHGSGLNTKSSTGLAHGPPFQSQQRNGCATIRGNIFEPSSYRPSMLDNGNIIHEQARGQGC